MSLIDQAEYISLKTPLPTDKCAKFRNIQKKIGLILCSSDVLRQDPSAVKSFDGDLRVPSPSHPSGCELAELPDGLIISPCSSQSHCLSAAGRTWQQHARMQLLKGLILIKLDQTRTDFVISSQSMNFMSNITLISIL